MKTFKFFKKNQDIKDVGGFDMYETIALDLISHCYQSDISPLGCYRRFNEDGLDKHLIITDLISHDYFECRHVRIIYKLSVGGIVNNITTHTFHLRQQDFIEIMRTYENV